tara:strand:+ start:53 stop:253 length:201 start_codon:yes stop_codon:yes gene_type:complete
MKNTTELREELVQSFNDLKKDKIDVQKAKAFVALSNSMLKSVSTEADYNKFLGKRTEIDFLKTPKS